MYQKRETTDGKPKTASHVARAISSWEARTGREDKFKTAQGKQGNIQKISLFLLAATDSGGCPCILEAHVPQQADSAQRPDKECPHPPAQGKEQMTFARSANWLLENIQPLLTSTNINRVFARAGVSTRQRQ